MMHEAIPFVAAVALASAFTPLVRHAALRLGYVAAPKPDRWHQTPTALHGGVAIYLAFAIPVCVLGASDHTFWMFFAAASFMFALGLLDDILHLQPYSKLIAQIVAACFVAANGVAIDVPGMPLLGLLVTIFWIVGITNALNLLDNMDGLSAGIGSIAAFCLGVVGLLTHTPLVSVMGFGLAGATLGFLFYNFYPAKIFMGDSGSLFLGFTLAALSIMGSWEQSTNIFLSMLVPILVLAVPIFDTAFVTIVRFFNGQAISQGGRDHTSHRMVAFGLPERTTVVFFYVMSAICGLIALVGVTFDLLYPSMLVILLFITFWYFGLFLSGIVSYEAENGAKPLRARQGFALNMMLMHKRRVGEVLVDCVLIGLCFTLAYVIRFEGLPDPYVTSIMRALPILIPLKLVVFFYFGLYRGIWRYVGMQDAIDILKAVSVSSVLSVVAVAMVFRFEGHARSVFVIDWMLLLLTVGGVRVLIRLIKEYLANWTQAIGRRLLILGAGDAGEIALREIRNNPSLTYTPVGFVDDDRQKLGRKIHGVPIIGSRQDLPRLVGEYGIEEILIAIPSVERRIRQEILSDCRKIGIHVQVMSSSRKYSSAFS